MVGKRRARGDQSGGTLKEHALPTPKHFRRGEDITEDHRG